LRQIEQEKRRRYTQTKGIKLTDYIAHTPDIPAQQKFLALDCKEAMYGGAAGGGKSDALLMAALQYVDVPGYAAIIFRKTYQDLSLPGGLIPRSHEWLANTDARYDNTTKCWMFPSGAKLAFGYMDSVNAHFRYQGTEFQFIGWDELTQFPEYQYTWMFNRLRATTSVKVPFRMRSATNPGGLGHTWVKKRFVDQKTKEPNAVFIPARVYDNPHIRLEEYINSLSYLDPVTRARYLDGDWVIVEAGAMFRRDWFEVVEEIPQTLIKVCAWDLAATEVEEGKDPDYTAGCVMARDPAGVYYILKMVRARRTPKDVEALVEQTAKLYGRETDYWMEQEPGSSGVNTIDRYKRTILRGYRFNGEKTTGKKADRARPFSSMCERGVSDLVKYGNVKLLRGAWVEDFLDEAEAFPAGVHDDQIDAASLAFMKLAKRGWTVPESQGGYVGAARYTRNRDDRNGPESPMDRLMIQP
jgi:predicted phage terminase large subunit-like protein